MRDRFIHWEDENRHPPDGGGVVGAETIPRKDPKHLSIVGSTM